MDSLFRHWLPCLLLCGFATSVAAQPFVHQPNLTNSNCSSRFSTAGGTQQTSLWSYCFETMGPTFTVTDSNMNTKTYRRIYQERGGLLFTNAAGCGSSSSDIIDTCHKNVRVCLLDTATNMPAGNVFVPETNGYTGPGGCSTFFLTNFKCGKAPVCCTDEEECPTPLVRVIVNGGGRVKDETFEGRRIDCPGTCSSIFAGGDWTVSLIATPDTGAFFAGWGGACSGTGPKCTVPLNKGERNVTATFVNCLNDTDCRLSVDPCTCTCVAGPRLTTLCKPQICPGDPCLGKSAVCVNGRCQVQEGALESTKATATRPRP